MLSDVDEGLHLDQQVQLSRPPLVQRRRALTDQRAEVLTQLQDLVQAVEDLGGGDLVRSASAAGAERVEEGTYGLQEDEGLGQQVAQEVVVSQSDALKVPGGVDQLEQLRELRLQHVHLRG